MRRVGPANDETIPLEPIHHELDLLAGKKQPPGNVGHTQAGRIIVAQEFQHGACTEPDTCALKMGGNGARQTAVSRADQPDKVVKPGGGIRNIGHALYWQ